MVHSNLVPYLLIILRSFDNAQELIQVKNGDSFTPPSTNALVRNTYTPTSHISLLALYNLVPCLLVVPMHV